MNQFIEIVVCAAVLALPFVVSSIYMNALEKNAKKIIQANSNSSSEIYTDLHVWFKHFNALKKKNKFDSNLYQTSYSFNRCDLILNDKNFVVIGKTKILGKYKALTPTIFEKDNTAKAVYARHVSIENIQYVGSDLEIEFTDYNYPNKITMVITNATSELKEKIKNVN